MSDLAITSLGVCSAAGEGVEALLDAVARGSCLATLDEALAHGLPVQFGGRAPQALTPGSDRAGSLADAALRELFAGAGLSAEVRRATGLVVGSGLGAMERAEAVVWGGARVTRSLHPHALTLELAQRHGLDGPLGTHTDTCVSALYGLEQAACELAAGRAPAMLCGGVETLSRTILGGFCALDALSKSAGPGGPPANDGIVLGEGACFVLVESPERAQGRGRAPRALIRGRGLHTDGTHMTSPDVRGRGMQAAVRQALEEASLGADAVEAITLTAPASPAYAELYRNALGPVLGAGWETRAQTWEEAVGHVLGASGALGLAFGTLLIEGRGGLPTAPKTVLALSVGFGGQSGATLLGAP